MSVGSEEIPENVMTVGHSRSKAETVPLKRRPAIKTPEQHRIDLLDTARRLFVENGVASTTVDQITTGAGVAKGTFYVYFTSKETLLDALRDQFIQDYVDGIKLAVAKRPMRDWRGRLSAWVKAAVAGHFDAVALHDIVYFERHPQPGEASGGSVVAKHLAALLRAGSSDHAWSVGDPEFTAAFLFHALHGTIHEIAAREKRPNTARMTREMEGLFFKVVGLALQRIMNRDEVIEKLRRHEADLKRIGVKSLYLFGSTARGDARADSDVDLFFDYDKGTLGLIELVRIRNTTSAVLGCKADIVPRDGINRLIRRAAEQDAMRVF